jgi:hypothetical protein
VDIKKKVVLIAVCAELVALGAVWLGRGKSGAKATVVAEAPADPARPAAMASPARHRVSPFSDHPFSANITITGKSVSYHGKMYAGRDALRTDMAMGHGMTASVIVRYDKGVSWTLMPGKHYIETPIDERDDLLNALHDTNANVKKQDLGPEKVGSYPCEKYKIEVTSRGHTQSGWIWVAKAKNLDGFIVKTQGAGSKESISLSEIQLSTPPASLFDLPPGYHKLTPAPAKTAPAHR